MNVRTDLPRVFCDLVEEAQASEDGYAARKLVFESVSIARRAREDVATMQRFNVRREPWFAVSAISQGCVLLVHATESREGEVT